MKTTDIEAVFGNRLWHPKRAYGMLDALARRYGAEQIGMSPTKRLLKKGDQVTEVLFRKKNGGGRTALQLVSVKLKEGD